MPNASANSHGSQATQPPAIPTDIAKTIIDPAAYADQRIFDCYAWLRANMPLGRAEPEGYDPFWVVTKHADILEISKKNDLFHSNDRSVLLVDKEGVKRTREITGGVNIIRSVVTMDAPEHPKYRLLTQAWFLPGNIRKLEDRLRTLVRSKLDTYFSASGQRDFVTDVALRYPLNVIMDIMGIPASDEPYILKLTQEVFGAQDPDMGRNATEEEKSKVAEHMAEVFADFEKYFAGIVEDRRTHPREDVATVIANGKVDGKPITIADAISYYITLATAGHDTTSSSLSSAIWGLCEFPLEFAKIKADPSLTPSLVEEAVRWATPVRYFMRSATADTELRGQRIAAGDWLMLAYLSGNRDEEVFDEAHTFKIDRKPNRQLAFGYGGHVCLGQHLAKAEIRIFLEEMLPRLKTLEFDGKPKFSEGVFVGGPKSLPIRYTV